MTVLYVGLSIVPIIQVESRQGVENIDAILGAGPVDVVEIGVGNLSTSLVDHAFIYKGTPGAGGVMTDLGTLPGGSWSQATSINALGQIVGLGQNATFNTRAMFWKPTSVTPPPTGTPPGGHDGDHRNQGDEDGDC